MREFKKTTTVRRVPTYNEPTPQDEVITQEVEEPIVRQRLIDDDVVYRSPATTVIYTVLNIIEALLALRLIFRLLGANPNNGVVNFLYTITAPLIAPFLGIFRQPVVAGSVWEWSTVIAMIIYAVIAYLIVQLVRAGTRRPVM